MATVSGSVNTTVSFASLVSPAIWSPPPSGLALVWKGPAKQSFGLAGDSFSSLQPTGATLTLSLTLHVGDTTMAFQSSAGECNVTITPALATNMGGTFQCTGLRTSDGSLTINANGSFSATG
jgi:hypothetical protein